MEIKFLLAYLVGVVLRFLGASGVLRYVKKSTSDEELQGHIGFHISACTVILGIALKVLGITLLASYLIYKYLL